MFSEALILTVKHENVETIEYLYSVSEWLHLKGLR